MQIGYVGLGAMGGALARRLLREHSLVVFDINHAAVAQFEKAGAAGAFSGADLAGKCDVIMMCLPRSSDVRAAIFASGGLAEGLSANKILIDQTSGNPDETFEMAEQLARQDVLMLDAPVSGGIRGAEAGTIAIMASGPKAAYEQVLSILNSISPNVDYCGNRIGNAQALKSINNAMNAGCRLATLEVVAMGKKMGLSLETMTEVLNKGSGRNRTSQIRLPAMLQGKRSSDFAMALMLKDVNLAVELGVKCRAPMLVTNVVRALLQVGINTLGEAAQIDEIVQLIETMAATRIIERAETA